MKLKLLPITACVLALAFCLVSTSAAQSDDRLGGTWKGPDPSLIRGILKSGGKSSSGAAPSRASVLKFTPAGDSGVAKVLADAFGRNPEERAALAEAFGQIKQGYEAEVAKEGKSNDLAAAMTFFIATNVAAYHQTDIPSDEMTEELFRSLRETMASVPAFAGLSNAEKQQMHDWLVCMAGLVLTSYEDAKQKNDAGGMKDAGELADSSMRLVLGVEVGKMSFAGNRLSVEGGNSAPPATSSTDNRIVGAWSISASNHAGSNLITNAGYYNGQYQFKPDGTYTFKSERWFGYLRSQEFYTTEESGTYTVNGDALTVSPKTSRTILRNPEGVVQKTQNNQLEKVTYNYRFQYVEETKETLLILQTSAETRRDGGFNGGSFSANSYIYNDKKVIVWKF